MDTINGLTWLVVILFIYFLPFMIAYSRNTVNKAAVFIINLLLGWTIIFWVVAIIMSYWKTVNEAKLQEEFYKNNIK